MSSSNDLREREEILRDAAEAREWAEREFGPVVDSWLERRDGHVLAGWEVVVMKHENGMESYAPILIERLKAEWIATEATS